MLIKKFVAVTFTTLTVVGSTIGMSLLSTITPLTQNAQAAYVQNCPFTAEIYQDTRIRPESNTRKWDKKWLYPISATQPLVVEFSTFVEGEAIWDSYANNGKGGWDSRWFLLSDGSGYVASAVVSGYPPTVDCKTTVSISTLPTTVTAANLFFKLQFQHVLYNPDGPSSSGNCGPASLAMALAALRLESPGTNVQKSIDDASNLMKRQSAKFSTWEELKQGIRNAGRNPEDASSWEALNSALAAQKPVILNGWLRDSWRNQFPKTVGSGDVGHLNVVLGKTSDGKYLMADPMHTGGVVAMTRDQLSVFFALDGQNGQPWGIAIGK